MFLLIFCLMSRYRASHFGFLIWSQMYSNHSSSRQLIAFERVWGVRHCRQNRQFGGKIVLEWFVIRIVGQSQIYWIYARRGKFPFVSLRSPSRVWMGEERETKGKQNSSPESNFFLQGEFPRNFTSCVPTSPLGIYLGTYLCKKIECRPPK